MDYGVFKSATPANSWSNHSEGIPGSDVTALAVDPVTPTTVYAGTWESGGVYKSTDCGGTWAAVGPAATSVHALAIDPVTPTILYAGTDGSGVFKTTDGGGTWHTLNTGLTNTTVRTLVIDPIEPRRVYAGTDRGGVFAIEQVNVCVGDCAIDGSVSVDEVITLVNIALGSTSIVECGSGDTNGNGEITIDEIIRAVNRVLEGCT